MLDFVNSVLTRLKDFNLRRVITCITDARDGSEPSHAAILTEFKRAKCCHIPRESHFIFSNTNL